MIGPPGQAEQPGDIEDSCDKGAKKQGQEKPLNLNRHVIGCKDAFHGIHSQKVP